MGKGNGNLLQYSCLEIPGTEEAGGLLSMRLHRVGQDWSTQQQHESESQVVQSCPVGYSPGFSRQGYWSGLPFPSPGDLPDPGIEPSSPSLQADALTFEPPGNLSSSSSSIVGIIVRSLTCFQMLNSHWLPLCRPSLTLSNPWSTEIWRHIIMRLLSGFLVPQIFF